MQDTLARSKALYARQNYRLALDFLEPRVNSKNFLVTPPQTQIQILDLLASLYEKFNKLSNARKCAAQMVSINPQDIRGYLRLGKVLQLLDNKVSESLKIYKRALLKVSPLHPHHKQFLNKQIENCQQKLIKQTPHMDFLPKLPHEILVLVFKQLTFKDRVNCSLVCKAWLQFMFHNPGFWCDVNFAIQKQIIIEPRTIAKYCDLSAPRNLKLDLSNVLVRNSESVINSIVSNPTHAQRLSLLKLNLTANTPPPLLRQIRKSTAQLTNLTCLAIFTNKPDIDTQWCLQSLPSIQSLELVTTQRAYPPSLTFLDSKCHNSKLSKLSVIGMTGEQVYKETFLHHILKLPDLVEVDLHRCVAHLWPVLSPLILNPQTRRIGFTASGINKGLTNEPLPLLGPQVTSVTLNNVNMSNATPMLHTADTPPPLNIDWHSPQITYVELKRVSISSFSLPQLLNFWGCTNPHTLVVHSSAFLEAQWPTTDSPQFCKLQDLEVVQFTHMGILLDHMVDWFIHACPNLRKLNLDGTLITGPQLVKLLTETQIKAVRCDNAHGVSASTVKWIHESHKVVTF